MSSQIRVPFLIQFPRYSQSKFRFMRAINCKCSQKACGLSLKSNMVPDYWIPFHTRCPFIFRSFVCRMVSSKCIACSGTSSFSSFPQQKPQNFFQPGPSLKSKIFCVANSNKVPKGVILGNLFLGPKFSFLNSESSLPLTKILDPPPAGTKNTLRPFQKLRQ